MIRKLLWAWLVIGTVMMVVLLWLGPPTSGQCRDDRCLLLVLLVAMSEDSQERPADTILPASDVVGKEYERPEELKDKLGLIAEFAINTNIYLEGVPHRLRFQAMLAPELAETWELTGTFNLRQRVMPSGQYESVSPGAYLIDPERLPYSKGVDIPDLERNGDYVLEVCLVSKETETDPVAAKELRSAARKLIMDARKMTVMKRPLAEDTPERLR